MLLHYRYTRPCAVPAEPDAPSLVFDIDHKGDPLDPIRVEAHLARLRIGSDAPPRSPVGGPTAPLQFELDPADGAVRAGSEAPASWTHEPALASFVYGIRRVARAYKGHNFMSFVATADWMPGAMVDQHEATTEGRTAPRWIDGILSDVDVSCCVQPDCDCNEVLVAIIPAIGAHDPRPARAYVDLATGAVHPHASADHDPRGPRLAARLVAEPDALDDLRLAYQRIRAAARGLSSPFRSCAATLRADERCPCGSRKVYRRCCGNLRPPPVDLDLPRHRARARDALRTAADERFGPGAVQEVARSALGPDVPDDLYEWYALYSLRVPHFTIADERSREGDDLDPRLRRYIEVVSGTPAAMWLVHETTATSATLAPILHDHAPLRVPLDRRPPWAVGEVLIAVIPEIDARPQIETCWRLGVSEQSEVFDDLIEAAELAEHHVERLLDPTGLIREVARLLAGEAPTER